MVGELDGLSRVSRIAEAYWHQQTRVPSPTRRAAFPVLIVPGMNHGQFADFGANGPPSEVAMYDLPAEVTLAQAQADAASMVALFIASAVGGSAAGSAALAKVQSASAAFLAPLVSSQLLEASSFLIPPCNDDPVTPECLPSCPFSPIAQSLLSGAAGSNGSSSYTWHMTVLDGMHHVDDLTPIHLPNITNACSSPDASCTLNATTVTQNTYDFLWSDFDVALYPCTAHEMRIKMTSRQNALVHAGVPVNNTNFNVTDLIPDRCAEVNAATFQWALAQAGASTRARYEAKGLPMRFGTDADAWMGPQFTYGSLSYTFVNGSSPFVWVNSTTLRTPLDYFLPETAGFHYCLLLSPARAMEFVYVDGLRSFLLA